MKTNSVTGMEFRMRGPVADSAWSAAYGSKVVIVPGDGDGHALTLAGNTFGYGARAGRAHIRGRAGNRFAVCLRKSHEGAGPRIVVEGVEANAFWPPSILRASSASRPAFSPSRWSRIRTA
jgi:glutamate synthase domain-containing protein 3